MRASRLMLGVGWFVAVLGGYLIGTLMFAALRQPYLNAVGGSQLGSWLALRARELLESLPVAVLLAGLARGGVERLLLGGGWLAMVVLTALVELPIGAAMHGLGPSFYVSGQAFDVGQVLAYMLPRGAVAAVIPSALQALLLYRRLRWPLAWVIVAVAVQLASEAAFALSLGLGPAPAANTTAAWLLVPAAPAVRAVAFALLWKLPAPTPAAGFREKSGALSPESA